MPQNAKNSQTRKVLLFIIASAFAFRICIGLLYYNEFDTFWYRGWALSLPEGFFDVYARAEQISLDYPPLYLFCLYFTGLGYRLFGVDTARVLQMLLMKFWPILFDSLCIYAIYLAARKKGETVAVFAAALWAVNPSAVFNSSFWGQTDGLMALLLVLSFMLADEHPTAACFMMAIAGLTKYQSLFFAPVLLLYIFRKYGVARLLRGCAAAAGTVAAVFLPFMIGARNPLLFFSVYFGGASTYPHCTLNAYNLYGIFSLNWIEDKNIAFLSLSFAQINTIVLLIIAAAVIYLMLKAARPNIYVGGLFIMQCLFMLTTRMHERYQIVVLPFALMAYVTTKNRHFLWQFWMLTFMTLINQAVLLFNINHSTFSSSADQIMVVMSIINMAIFIHTVYAVASYSFKKEDGNDLNATKALHSAPAEE